MPPLQSPRFSISVEIFPAMPRDDDDLPANAPSIVPDRDDVEQFQRQKTARQKPATVEPVPELADAAYDEPPAPAAGRTAVYVLGAVAAIAVIWAGVLQMQLGRTQSDLDAWQMRVADLEKRLSVTDESTTQSTAALQVKLKEQEDVLVKLRDDSVKRATATLGQHTNQIAALEQSLKSTQATATKADKALDELTKSYDATRTQVEKLSPTVELTKRKLEEQQAAIESLTEKGNVTSASVEKLTLRVNTNEEWVQSINNFRKQTNREIVNIKQQIGGPVSEAAPR
jgi:methyl-accepting chemotaxis protein